MRPNPNQQRDYLLQISFRAGGCELDRFISRAYRDMNRTFGGIGKLHANNKRNNELKAAVLNDAKAKIKNCFNSLRDKRPQKMGSRLILEFDAWHTDSCKSLICLLQHCASTAQAGSREADVRSGPETAQHDNEVLLGMRFIRFRLARALVSSCAPDAAAGLPALTDSSLRCV